MNLLRLQVPDQARREHITAIGEIVLRESTALGAADFDSIGTSDLARMFALYDQRFFDNGYLTRTVLEKTGAPLRFRLSSRMIRAGGATIRTRVRQPGGKPPKTHLEIAIATRLLLMTFRDDVERDILVGGIRCENRLQALQRIMEHEIIHLAEMLLWNRSSCAAPRFKLLVKNIFGHTHTNHRLVTPREHAARVHNIHAGQSVEFDFKGVRYVGVVNRIHHRATVLVKSPRGSRYSDGQKYLKFLIPLPDLLPSRG